MMNSAVSITPCGDRALTVTAADTISVTANRMVQSLAAQIQQKAGYAVVEMIPSYCALVIEYRPEKIRFTELKALIENELSSCSRSDASAARLLHIPCCYQRRFAPDLEETARIVSLTTDEVISLHSSRDYRIFMIGFLPGFPYLGGMDRRIAAPRLTTPRTSIPAGSVGIGGSQTGIYPVASPGGWRLIGQTPLSLYDPTRAEPILCRAGDYIRFVPVSLCDFYDIRHDILKGTYQLPITQITVKEDQDDNTGS